MQNFEYKKEDFKSDSLSNYKRSIQYNLDGFSFWLKGVSSNEIIYFRHFPFRLSNDSGLVKKIAQIIAEEPFLRDECAENVIFNSTRNTLLIPGSFMSSEYAWNLLSFNFGNVAKTSVKWLNRIADDTCLIFLVEEKVQKIIEKKYKNPIYSHILDPLLNYSIYMGDFYRKFSLLYFTSGGFFFLVIHESKPVFLNYFELKNPNDLTFYLLSVFRSLYINDDENYIFLCGDTGKRQALTPYPLQNLKAVPISNIPENIADGIFNHIPFHEFFCLIY